MIRVAIVGGTGYTGAELLRLLCGHPDVELVAVSSRSEAGKAVSALFPNLAGHVDMAFSEPDQMLATHPDVVFFATPHGVAQASVEPVLNAGVRVIDLSADFRIRDRELWELWYGQSHQAPHLLSEAVYGLPEITREQIAGARLIACAGCYPTSVQLALAPLLEARLIDPLSIIASCGSGVSGAGRNAKIPYLITEASENFQAYSIGGHRHEPEIVQGCRDLQAADDTPAEVLFLPHLVPMIRGIHSTVIANLNGDATDLQRLFEERYAGEAFVQVLAPGSHPQTRYVRGTNCCQIAVHQRGQRVVVLAAEDNLTKGASGQAIQCMNIMFGLAETTGLIQPALLP